MGSVTNVSRYHGLHQPNPIPRPSITKGIIAKSPMNTIISLLPLASSPFRFFASNRSRAKVILPNSASAFTSMTEWTYTILVTMQPMPTLIQSICHEKGVPVSAACTPNISSGPNIRPMTNSPRPWKPNSSGLPE